MPTFIILSSDELDLIEDVDELLMADMLLLLLQILTGSVCRALRSLLVILALFGVVDVCWVEELGRLLLAELLNFTRLLDV